MHKIFAKPSFLGKKVIFLPQCHSTNDELSSLLKRDSIPEGTLVYTDHQLSGRGQRGNRWEDEPKKSLLFSILLKPKKLLISSQYLLNLISGLAILDVLREESIRESKLKWPNDVYLNGKKIAGVLIENYVKGSKIECSVVGIGLNLNQENLSTEGATSIHLQTHKYYDREDFMESIILSLEFWYLKLIQNKYNEILKAYHSLLLWKDEIHTFTNGNEVFDGIIRGINGHGKLIVEKDGIETTYDIKEIQFVS